MRTLLHTQIRPMTPDDITQITEIERESFSTAWPPTAYRRELQNRLGRYMVISEVPEEAPPASGGFWGTIRRIVSSDAPPAPSERILGFIGVWLMMGEAHIVTVAVRSTHRRNGIGERLLIECIDMAMAEEQESVTLEVRKSNEAAQTLYYKYGFARVGLRLRYYTDNQEDAVIMTTPDISGAGFLTQYQALKSRHQARYPELWA